MDVDTDQGYVSDEENIYFHLISHDVLDSRERDEGFEESPLLIPQYYAQSYC